MTPATSHAQSQDYRTQRVEDCPRCGEDHGEPRFKRFREPARLAGATFAWWWTCPETREPILAEIPPPEGL